MLRKVFIFVFLILTFARINAAQSAKADYRFENTRRSSVAGAPDLTDIGPNGSNTFAGATVDGASRTVLQFPVSNGLRLAPTSGVAANDVYTIVMLFEFDNISMTAYKRIADFKNGTSENGFYLNNGYLSFYVGSLIAQGTTFLQPNIYHQIVLTRDAAGIITAYADGVQQFSFNDSALRAGVIDSNDALRFFRDNEGSPEHTSGTVARIRVFDTALSALEVASLDRLVAPTAASVVLGGRVFNAGGQPVSKAFVTLTGADGAIRTALTNPFGYYRFEAVAVGETYVLSVVSKQYQFAPQVVFVMDEASELNFFAEP